MVQLSAATLPGNRYGMLNQDAVLVDILHTPKVLKAKGWPQLFMAVVLDGHGMLGEDASREAGKTLLECVKGDKELASRPLNEIPTAHLTRMFEDAFYQAHVTALTVGEKPPSTYIYPKGARNQRTYQLRNIAGGDKVYIDALGGCRFLEYGTTATFVLVQGRSWAAANVGDSLASVGLEVGYLSRVDRAAADPVVVGFPEQRTGISRVSERLPGAGDGAAAGGPGPSGAPEARLDAGGGSPVDGTSEGIRAELEGASLSSPSVERSGGSAGPHPSLHPDSSSIADAVAAAMGGGRCGKGLSRSTGGSGLSLDATGRQAKGEMHLDGRALGANDGGRGEPGEGEDDGDVNGRRVSAASPPLPLVGGAAAPPPADPSRALSPPNDMSRSFKLPLPSSQEQGVTAVYEAEFIVPRHNLEEASERARLAAHPGAARALEEGPDGYATVVSGKLAGFQLAMSRALGHRILSRLGIVPKPDVRRGVLPEDAVTLIVASDGIWESLTPAEATRTVCDALAEARGLPEAVLTLVRSAIDRALAVSGALGADNTTAAVFLFDDPPEC